MNKSKLTQSTQQLTKKTNTKTMLPKSKSIPIPIKEGKREKEEKIIERPVVIKQKKKKSKTKMRVKGFLARHDAWLGTIANPFDVHGVRVPDSITTPSATFSIWNHQQLTVNANGLAAICLGAAAVAYPGTAVGGLVPHAISSTGGYVVGCTHPATATTSSNIFGNSGATLPTTFALSQWASDTSTVPANFSQARLVSCGLSIQFTGNLLNAQGTITLVSAPRNWLRNNRGSGNWSIGGISLAMLQSHPSVQILSIPKYMGGSVIWKPIDQVSYMYCDLNQTFNLSTDTVPDEYLGGEIYAVVTGAVANQAFQVDICWNFEGIPQANQFDIVQAETSKSDSLSMEHTLNVLPELPTSVPIPAPTLEGKTEGRVGDLSKRGESEPIFQDSHPAQENSLLEQLFNGVEDFVDRGVKIASKVSPLITALL